MATITAPDRTWRRLAAPILLSELDSDRLGFPQDEFDVGQAQARTPEQADELPDADLGDAVTALPGALVGQDVTQQADAVVDPQRPGRQARSPRELTDRDEPCYEIVLHETDPLATPYFPVTVRWRGLLCRAIVRLLGGERGRQMLAESLIALAALAGNTVVAAATTDAWEAARRKFAQLLGRGNPDRTKLAELRLDQTREQLEGVTGQELEMAQANLGKTWQVRLEDLLEEDPGVEVDLRALVEEIRATLPPTVVSAADHAVVAGGNVNISADRGGVAAGVIHGDVTPPGPTSPGPATT